MATSHGLLSVSFALLLFTFYLQMSIFHLLLVSVYVIFPLPLLPFLESLWHTHYMDYYAAI